MSENSNNISSDFEKLTFDDEINDEEHENISKFGVWAFPFVADANCKYGEKEFFLRLREMKNNYRFHVLSNWNYIFNNVNCESDFIIYDTNRHCVLICEAKLLLKGEETVNIEAHLKKASGQVIRTIEYLNGSNFFKRKPTFMGCIVGSGDGYSRTNFIDFEKNDLFGTIDKKPVLCLKEDMEDSKAFSTWFENLYKNNIDLRIPNEKEKIHNEKEIVGWMRNQCLFDINRNFEKFEHISSSLIRKFKDKPPITTTEQYQLINCDKDFVWVKGFAGTGKTLCALHIANKWKKISSDAEIMFICFTAALSKEISSALNNIAKVKTLEKIKQKQFKTLEKIKQKKKQEKFKDKKFCFIIDEAQDIDCEVIEKLKIVANKMWVFEDKLQCFINKKRKAETKIGYELFKLTKILRHTVQIHDVVSIFLPKKKPIKYKHLPCYKDVEFESIECNNGNPSKTATKSIIDACCECAKAYKHCVLLFPSYLESFFYYTVFDEFKELLGDHNISLYKVIQKHEIFVDNFVLLSTIKKFSGLEMKTAILVVPGKNDNLFIKNFYLGATRAINLLKIFVSEEIKNIYCGVKNKRKVDPTSLPPTKRRKKCKPCEIDSN